MLEIVLDLEYTSNIQMEGKMSDKSKDVKELEQEVVPPKELSEEEYAKLMEDLDDFENKFLECLAGTHKFEIVPTSTEDGAVLNPKHYTLIKQECRKHGLKIIYSIEVGPKQTTLWCPETMKIGIIDSTNQVH